MVPDFHIKSFFMVSVSNDNGAFHSGELKVHWRWVKKKQRPTQIWSWVHLDSIRNHFMKLSAHEEVYLAVPLDGLVLIYWWSLLLFGWGTSLEWVETQRFTFLANLQMRLTSRVRVPGRRTQDISPFIIGRQHPEMEDIVQQKKTITKRQLWEKLSGEILHKPTGSLKATLSRDNLLMPALCLIASMCASGLLLTRIQSLYQERR